MLRSPLRSPFVDLLRPSIGAAGLSIVQKAIGILRKYGTDAHVYLPGIGTVSGLTAGNYLDSAGTTAATIDNPVGLVVDSFGSINATQGTTANKPILRQSGGKYSWQFDGTDSLTTTFSAGTLGANSDVFMVVRRDTVSSTVLAYSADNNNKYIGSCATSGTSAVSGGAGTPTHYVNGIVLSAQTEVAMSAALPAGSTCIVEVQGADLSTWVNFNVGYYAATPVYALRGSIYDCIICPAMTADERTTMRRYLAQKNGVSL